MKVPRRHRPLKALVVMIIIIIKIGAFIKRWSLVGLYRVECPLLVEKCDAKCIHVSLVMKTIIRINGDCHFVCK